ncbi:Hypothetical protein FKW44_017256, partial [Caligus rogercresseyi]
LQEVLTAHHSLPFVGLIEFFGDKYTQDRTFLRSSRFSVKSLETVFSGRDTLVAAGRALHSGDRLRLPRLP